MNDARARAAVAALIGVTRRIVDPAAAHRQELCRRLVSSTGLSQAGVEWALSRCLELEPSAAELERLFASTVPAPRAHVILPSNVFVAAHRAIALALASAPRVFVKPSRREPVWVDALLGELPGLFERVEHLTVEAGDHVFAYGSDATLSALRSELPGGAVLHAYGAGFGVVIVDLAAERARGDRGLGELAERIADDTIAFDQRGCLSPRLVLAVGNPAHALGLAQAVAAALDQAELRVPRGALDATELAEARWYQECAACFGTVFPAGKGYVSARDPDVPRASAELVLHQSLPPTGRHLEVLCIADLGGALDSLRPWLTSVGCSGEPLSGALQKALPRARVVALGRMQTPEFDGPVDRRPDPAGEIIRARE